MPKAFISYSWTSAAHQSRIRSWAEQLIGDGVDVVFDQYDLKEGQDKYTFMERMVNDSSVTHVIIFSDKAYAEKADKRQSGVGTESQIISREVYERVGLSKFIPVVCGFDENAEPLLPVYLKSRFWIDFSSEEKVHQNWEQLIRCLHGRPMYEKPALGKAPAYLVDERRIPSSPTISKFRMLRQAVLEQRKGVDLYRTDFIDACIEYADSLRTRERPQAESLGHKIVEDCGRLSAVRDDLVDWVLLEASIEPTTKFPESLNQLLERLLSLRERPPEVNQWNDAWPDAHGVFCYETFLYIVAALLRVDACAELHNVFESHYLLTPQRGLGNERFVTFHRFYAFSRVLNSGLSENQTQFHSPAAELVRRQANRSDITFANLMQAELLVFMMSCLKPNRWIWFPQTFFYASYSDDFPFFVRATQARGFGKLEAITGTRDIDEIRKAINVGVNQLRQDQKWFFVNIDPIEALNIDKWNSLR